MAGSLGDVARPYSIKSLAVMPVSLRAPYIFVGIHGAAAPDAGTCQFRGRQHGPSVASRPIKVTHCAENVQ